MNRFLVIVVHCDTELTVLGAYCFRVFVSQFLSTKRSEREWFLCLAKFKMQYCRLPWQSHAISQNNMMHGASQALWTCAYHVLYASACVWVRVAQEGARCRGHQRRINTVKQGCSMVLLTEIRFGSDREWVQTYYTMSCTCKLVHDPGNTQHCHEWVLNLKLLRKVHTCTHTSCACAPAAARNDVCSKSRHWK